LGDVGTEEGETPKLSAPEPFGSSHDPSDFNSGSETLDDWLRRRALKNEGAGASRTYVICAGGKVRGYYCVAAGSVELIRAPGRVRRNMPDPLPVMVIGRLAVQSELQRRGLGLDLLRDAVQRTRQAARIVGIRAILVHALSEDAARFYRNAGFKPSLLDPMTLMVTLADVEAALGLPL
jgi:GNAT superfamily N-acetyltransferase